jgi:hypothetical protein
MRSIIALLCLLSALAHAEWTLVVPQEPGSGTAVWSELIARHLSKQLNEPVVIRHIPGAKDIPGFNKWHNEMRDQPKTIMVSHGGNAVSYLVDKVDYDYGQYASVGMMNLDIVVGIKKGANPKTDKLKFAYSSGAEPDGIAMALMACGPKSTTIAYLNCFRDRFVWINSMKGNERRMAYIRNELNVTRETPAAWNKFYTEMTDTVVWFTHGVYDFKQGKQVDDANYPGFLFETVYEKTWGEKPKGELYRAYVLARTFRDSMQKALWVNKDNPHTEQLRKALRSMTQDPASTSDIERDSGKYGWILGRDGDKVVSTLRRSVTEQKLKTLGFWFDNAYQFKTVFKPELVSK